MRQYLAGSTLFALVALAAGVLGFTGPIWP